MDESACLWTPVLDILRSLAELILTVNGEWIPSILPGIRLSFNSTDLHSDSPDTGACDRHEGMHGRFPDKLVRGHRG